MSKTTVQITTLLWQLAAISLCAIGLCLFGFVLLGISPALVACFWAVSRLKDYTAGTLVLGMWRQFRAEFVRANLIATPLVVGSLISFWFVAIGPTIADPLWIAVAVLLLAKFSGAIVTLACMTGSISEGWLNTLTAMALAPFQLLFSTLLLAVVVLVSIWQPLVGIYFAPAVWALTTNLVVLRRLASALPNRTALDAEAPA